MHLISYCPSLRARVKWVSWKAGGAGTSSSQISPNGAVSQKGKWYARSRCGFAMRQGKRDKDCWGRQILLYPLRQAGQGFDFSAPAVVKLVAVPMHSPQCLEQLGTICTAIMSKTTPCPGCMHTQGPDQEPAVRRERKCHWSWLCPGKGCSATRDRHTQDVYGNEETHAAKPGGQELCAWL